MENFFLIFNRTNQIASQGQPIKLNNAFLYKITKYFISPILNIKIVQLADCLCLILQHHFGFTNILFTRVCFHTCTKNVNLKWNMKECLSNWRTDNTFVGLSEMTLGRDKRREVTERHNAQRYLDQSKDWIVCNHMLFCIYRSIWCHSKCFVDTLIFQIYLTKLMAIQCRLWWP